MSATNIDAEAAAVIAAKAAALLGHRIGTTEAEQLGTTAIQALRADGWTIQVDLRRRIHHASPLLRSWDPAILAGLARGYSVQEIATGTGTPYGTLRHRVLRLRARIGAANAAHAVAIAYESGWMAGLAPEPRGPLVLSRRQHQVLALMAGGKTNQAIGRIVELSPASVITYVRRLYAALDASRPGDISASTRPHAVALGYQHGLLPLASTDHQPAAAAS